MTEALTAPARDQRVLSVQTHNAALRSMMSRLWMQVSSVERSSTESRCLHIMGLK